MVPHPAPRSPPLCLIPEYFAGKEVFITGATGFVGKVLVERLLWTCPDVSRLHLVMRQKRDVAPDMRLKQLRQCQVFNLIRQYYPERLEKLSVLAGDITKHNFGMDKESLDKLAQVSVVFHLAATVKFDEPLAVAVEQNLRSILTLMDICDQLPRVQVLVYVSTAYSNADLSIVEERVYPAPARLQQIFALVDHLPDHVLAEVTPKLISPKPNTYTFTKAMAESALAERAPVAPYATAIFRPSIVTSSLQHPFPGWIGSFNGPSGVLVGMGKGLLHVLMCDEDARADMVPVDIVADTLIAVAWETGIEDGREARVYHCSSYDNPILWGEFKMRAIRELRHHPFDGPLWYPFCFFTKNRLVLIAAEWLLMTAPLHGLNFLYTTFGVKQRTKLSTICLQLRVLRETITYFLMKEWRFNTDNAQRLRARLAPADAAVYNLDPQSIDWAAHFAHFVRGIRKYLLRQSDRELRRARCRMRLLCLVHRLAQCAALFAVYRVAARAGGSAAILKAFRHRS